MTTATDLAEAQSKLPIRGGQRPRRGFVSRGIKPFFGTPINALVTLACLWILWLGVKAAYGWLIVRAVTAGGAEACKVGQGACWPFFAAKLRFMIFGIYPYDEQWRVALAMILFLGMIGISMVPRFWTRALLGFWAATIVVTAILISGGILGLSHVPTTQWSGLPLSFLLSAVGLALGFPLGVVLALARASNLPAIRVLAVVFIEVIRGVPLISILFMASVMLPLFMPSGITIDKLLRAQVAIIIFAAAYIAEAIRGGLQAIPQGQHEASNAMGLHYWQSMRLIVLPQALKIAIPPLVNISIGFFQDTTLVTIIGLLDFLSTVRTAMQDPSWIGLAVVEGYVFAAFIYFVFSYIMGAYSRFLERRARLGHD
ncbi:amino acid ABC transporter permease [Microvirga pudoricolor]|uniref:amino acid ABC transporter permease n=1 Tax=Microvirga pudoricolor TaxID=2778729 RepID=UPI001951A3BB|nr:amino acid ABC transporter permease [Microvirga pudoricolor]MBM6592527.1 amino acid ABC transporter permease [Microvirga pudoricolor]